MAKQVERDYTTTLIEEAAPPDLTAISEMIARQILSDNKLTNRGDHNNDD